jgi:hypothetical protein
VTPLLSPHMLPVLPKSNLVARFGGDRASLDPN